MEVRVAIRAGKHLRYLADYQMAASLGSEKSFALPVFHALTGLDTVSAVVEHNKKTA